MNPERKENFMKMFFTFEWSNALERGKELKEALENVLGFDDDNIELLEDQSKEDIK